MELSECRFYCGGDGMRFLIYSDALCCIRYQESIRVPFGEGLVDVYEIELGLECQWVVVRQGKREAEGDEYRWFLRQGSRFLERQCAEMPQGVQAQIPDIFQVNLPDRTLKSLETTKNAASGRLEPWLFTAKNFETDSKVDQFSSFPAALALRSFPKGLVVLWKY